MNCCPPDSSVHGIFLARNWSGLPFPLPRDPPHPGIKLMSPVSSVLAGRFFTIKPSRQTPVLYVQFSCSVVSGSLQHHELQQAKPPCTSPTPRVHSDSHPSSQ